MTRTQHLVRGMRCAACVSHVTQMVEAISGVQKAEVNLATGKLLIHWVAKPNLEELQKTFQTDGSYRCLPWKNHSTAEENRQEIQELWRRILPSATIWLGLVGMMMLPGKTGESHSPALGWCQAILVLAIFFCHRQTLLMGFRRLFRSPSMDTLVALGCTASFLLSLFSLCRNQGQGHLYFEAAGMILVVTSIGKLLEAYARKRAGQALENWRNQLPHTAHLRQGTQYNDSPVTEIQPGDILRILPGEHIPLDGTVLSGQSEINEAALTGESVPRAVKTGDAIFAGTINLIGSLDIRVTKAEGCTMMDSILEMISQSALHRGKWIRLADRLASLFVPLVLLLTLLTFLTWFFCGAAWEDALIRGISLLVISCPCALGLATPLAVTLGAQLAAGCGVLFRNPETWEKLPRIGLLFLDKTGTVTTGRPQVTQCIAEETELILMAAAAVEQHSEHPFAKAILRYAEAEGIEIPEIRNFKMTIGAGVSGELGKITIRVGTEEFTEIPPFPEADTLRNSGHSVLYVRCGEATGLIALQDTLLPGTEDAIQELRQQWHLEVGILSGDKNATVQAIAKKAGISVAYGELLPADKARHIQSSRNIPSRQADQASLIGMVGDGINDAPAFSVADCSFAMGTGSDLAKETADILLLHPDLRAIVRTFVISKQVNRIIRQNLFWAFFYNFLAFPLAAGLLIPLGGPSLSPAISSLCMACSSLFVVLNSLRLLHIKSSIFTK